MMTDTGPAEKELAQKLRAFREQLSMSQMDMSRYVCKVAGLNWDRRAVAGIESGTRRIRLEEALALRALFGMDYLSVFCATFPLRGEAVFESPYKKWDDAALAHWGCTFIDERDRRVALLEPLTPLLRQSKRGHTTYRMLTFLRRSAEKKV